MTNFDYSQVSELLGSLPTGLWLEGKNVAATGGATFEVLDPATEEVIANVADGTSADWMRALELADAAQKEWAGFAPRTRSIILTDIFNAINERKEDFARVMTLEMGKPYAEALGEVAYGAEGIEEYISVRYIAKP